MSLTLHDVGHGFDGRPSLFTGVARRFERGRVCAVTGPSGSGKSTLLGIAAGMLEPLTGTVERAGIERTAWVFQNPHGSPRRTALDHVVLPVLATGSTRRDAERMASRLLADFGLGARAGAAFGELSGGEAQRLLLARAVAARPDLLLVDEPTAQLDRPSAEVVGGAMRALAGSGAIVIVATHDAAAIDACDDVLDLGGRRSCE